MTFKELNLKARKLVNKWDPCDLIEAGAPDNEYDSITNKIVSGISNGIEKENITDGILDLLEKYYGIFELDKLSPDLKGQLIKEIESIINELETNANTR